MKSQLIAIVAAVLVVGCGESQQSAPAPEVKPAEPVAEAAQPKPPTAKAPDISINRAASEGNIEAVKQYLADGADVNAKDEGGWSVLDNALGSNNEELINFVKANGGKSNADKSIFIASGIGDLEAVKQHLATGADVNAKLDRGYTALHYAVGNGRREVVNLLLANGADVNAKDDVDGDTPLDSAYKKQIRDLLRKHGGKTGEELGYR
jgi:ankyrin repeat protein